MTSLSNILKKISRIGYVISAGGVVLIMALISVDILLRTTINVSILGCYEIIEVIMSICVFMSFAYTQTKKGHVHVTMLISKLPAKARFICFSLTSLLSTALAGAIAVAAFYQGLEIIRKGTSTGVLAIPYFPFYFVESLAMALFTLVLLGDSIQAFMAIFNPHVAEEVESTWTS